MSTSRINLNATNTFLAALAILVTIFVTWYFNHDKSTSLNVERLSATQLTQDLHIDGLTSKYLYHDSIPVKNLWKATYTIKNTGEQTLYGKGFSSTNVENGEIPVSVIDCNKVLSVKVTDANNGSALTPYNAIKVSQWMPNEFIELEILAEGRKVPRLSINPRGIQDATVTYSEYTPAAITADRKLIDHLPISVANTLKWLAVVAYTIILIAFISQAKGIFNENSRIVNILSGIILLIFIVILFSPILWIF